MGDNPPPIFGMLAAGFMNMAPAMYVIVSSVLLVLSLWLAWHSWRSSRILYGTTLTPASDLRSPPRGLVKLQGAAEAPAPPGMGPPGIVFQEITRSNSSGSGVSSSTLRSTGWVLLANGDHRCALDLRHTKVMPTSSESSHAFLDRDRWSSSGIIHRGDQVFALGRLDPGVSKEPGAPDATCTLRPSWGVLVYSGMREGGVRFIYSVYLLIQLTGAVLLLTTLVWGALIHLDSYPPLGRGRFVVFLESLRDTPWRTESGLGHPGWAVPVDSAPSS